MVFGAAPTGGATARRGLGRPQGAAGMRAGRWGGPS